MAAVLPTIVYIATHMSSFSHSSCFSVFLLLLPIISPTPTSASSPTKVSYAEHCGEIVPQSSSTGVSVSPLESFQISDGYYTGGDQIFAADKSYSPPPEHSGRGTFQFHAQFVHRTRSTGTFQIGGSLSVDGPQGKYTERRSRYHRQGLHAFVTYSRTSVHFDLSGFWSESTELLCMVGTGSSYRYKGKGINPSVVFKLHFPKTSNISTSLVNGTVESIDPIGNSNYFDKMSVVAYASRNYSYTQLNKIRDSYSQLKVPSETRAFEKSSLCSYIPNLLRGSYRFEEGTDPFSGLTGSSPNYLSLNQIFCSEENLHMRIGISNSSTHWYDNPLEPKNSLVVEGFWDLENNQLCLAACRVLATQDSPEIASVGDCSIGLRLWFPLILSIKNRSTVVGRMWTNKDKNDPDYFTMASFGDLGYHLSVAPGMKYEYSLLDDARKLYNSIKKPSNTLNKTYPDGNSKRDMSFSISLTRGESSASGHASVLSFANTLYVDSFLELPQAADVYVTLWNVSYDIYYWNRSDSSSSTKLSAEGLYNSQNGLLCMVGCMYPKISSSTKQNKTDDSMDCNILINFQLPPMNPEAGEVLNGTIKSTRKISDPLYFEPLLVLSYPMYDSQAAKIIRRMDIEIIMVIISLTLSCIFIRWQILYAKKHQDVLPSISLTMLFVMTVGYLIPLILNFEALLIMIHNTPNNLIWSSEWIVVKEVVVRVLTLVTFILHLRLLQVVWSADEGKTDLLVDEKKTMVLCLILYFIGAVIAWSVLSRNKSYIWVWEDLLSYAGLILDAFLLPQIITNIFRNSKENALSMPYYVGMTAIRAIPHLYDLCRAHFFLPYFQSSYIYASPDVEYFSSAWDIIIPSAGVLFASLIFMQQRFGGKCILPARFRKHDGYVTIAELNL